MAPDRIILSVAVSRPAYASVTSSAAIIVDGACSIAASVRPVPSPPSLSQRRPPLDLFRKGRGSHRATVLIPSSPQSDLSRSVVERGACSGGDRRSLGRRKPTVLGQHIFDAIHEISLSAIVPLPHRANLSNFLQFIAMASKLVETAIAQDINRSSQSPKQRRNFTSSLVTESKRENIDGMTEMISDWALRVRRWRLWPSTSSHHLDTSEQRFRSPESRNWKTRAKQSSGIAEV
ncbi:hypothetical protein E3N88_29652 [Mikania micrantha]|uniref:Uncharacterized protein n=1 Tax=Mikania micrantha TaxID=192012 RepID=A0A5N6MKC8_9ASTR|nr:hypothetical protein E3N88_29652 [Mikania micrantha]